MLHCALCNCELAPCSAQGWCHIAIERLTIGQVAARYDVSTDTIRRRIRRGLLPARRDNHGQWWVELDPGAPPPASLAPPRPPTSASLAPTTTPSSPATQPPPSSEWVELHERAATAEGEARGLREALRVAEDAAAEANRRAERAERAAVEAWEQTVDLARRLAVVQAPTAPVAGLPASPQHKGFLARLLGR